VPTSFATVSGDGREPGNGPQGTGEAFLGPGPLRLDARAPGHGHLRRDKAERARIEGTTAPERLRALPIRAAVGHESVVVGADVDLAQVAVADSFLAADLAACSVVVGQ
jgi:hypothetical protein